MEQATLLLKEALDQKFLFGHYVSSGRNKQVIEVALEQVKMGKEPTVTRLSAAWLRHRDRLPFGFAKPLESTLSASPQASASATPKDPPKIPTSKIKAHERPAEQESRDFAATDKTDVELTKIVRPQR